MLGPEAVVTAVLGGGAVAADQVRLVPWGDERTPARPPAAPWPGRLPPPAPALVLPVPLAADVHDAAGAPVAVSARLEVSAAPARLAVGRRRTGGDRRLGRPVAGRRALVGAGRGPPAAPGSRSASPTAAPCCSPAEGRWVVEAIYD